jgi:PAS domain S-box-containing protein
MNAMADAGTPLELLLHRDGTQPLRVLLVEHSELDAELNLRELKKAGFRLTADIASTLEELDRLLKEKEYDIILADYRMPGWTGLDALSAIHDLKLDLPFVLVTGTLGEELAVECIKRGVTDYVLKDHLARLPVAVARALEDKSLRDARSFMIEALRLSESNFRFLFANNPLPMGVYDERTLRYLQVNDAAVARYGYSRQEFLQMKITDLRSPEGWVDSQLRPENAGGFPSSFSSGRHVCKDGTIIDVEVFGHRIEFAGRRAVLVVAQDVTDRKRAEKALRDSEGRFREFIENATYGIFRASMSGELLYANPALVRMLGYGTLDELRSKNLAEIAPGEAAERDGILEQFKSVDRIEGVELNWKRKNGTLIRVRVSGWTSRGADGRTSGVEMFVEDVTEWRALERQVRQIQKFEAIGQLAGGIAHDFNNVIGAILGWAELGQELAAVSHDRLSEYFQKIRTQCERASGLTRQLLAFSHRQILEPRNMSINQAVIETLSLLEKVIGKDIEMKAALDPATSVIRADPTQMEQMLMNLCLNARDAMPQGGRLLIETKNAVLTEEDRKRDSSLVPGEYAELSVSDTGTGMDMATRERIFEPFFTTKERGKGTGLGLATVYGIVRQHGGILQVQSQLGKGSTFRVFLPSSDGAIEQEDRPETPPPGAASEGTETILIAEDHEGIRELARATLEGLGYRVLLAADGQEAVEQFEAHRSEIQVALLDVVLPKLGGRQVYERIKAMTPGLPVVFATGYSTEAEALGKLAGEGVPVLQKPYSPALLGRKVREALDRTVPVKAYRQQ